MYQLLEGKKIALEIEAVLKEKISKLDVKPKLTVILVGDNQASQVYVKNKELAAKRVGIETETIVLDKNIQEDILIDLINKYNSGEFITDGLLVQLPLPNHINSIKVIEAIDPRLDVDGFHPVNVGNTWLNQKSMYPCTPAGIIRLLERYNIDLVGKKAKIIGRSNIVGKPLASLLLEKDATVTILHSSSNSLSEECKTADILISAIGKPKYITKDYIKKGAVVIDVGINRDTNNKLCGDVDFDSVAPLTSYITPVPGGVGPMTIAMLLEQTYNSYKRNRE